MDTAISLLKAVQPLGDCDGADRLSYVYTAALCIVFGLFVSGWSFVGQPIQCWFPKYFTGESSCALFCFTPKLFAGFWGQYAHDYCFVQNTYFLPMSEKPANSHRQLVQQLMRIPQNVTAREDRLIGEQFAR